MAKRGGKHIKPKYDIEKMAEFLEDKRELSSEDENVPDYRQDFFDMYAIMRESKAAEELRPHQVAFLAAYAILGNVSQAAKCTGISPSTPSGWYDDETFMKYYELADQAHSDYLISEAQRRAVEGYKEPQFYQGEIVGYKRKFSDNLLMFLIKGKMPETFREHSTVEVQGNEDKPIRIEFVPPEMNEQLDTTVIESEAEEVE